VTSRVGLCVSKRRAIFFKVLPYNTVRVFLLRPASTRHRHVR